MSERRNWTVEEVRSALSLYLRTSFGRIHNKNPEIISLAMAIGRTPSAVALKMSNLAALDESLARKGMQNASALDRQVWAEFLEQPEFVVSAVTPKDKRTLYYPQPDKDYSNFHMREGEDKTVSSTQRVGQQFFREMILASYGNRCALTGIEAPQLLVASHIVGWAENKSLRMRPQNGICLNNLHDKAFDRHLITFDEDYRMIIAEDLPEKSRRALGNVESKTLRMPEKFFPDQSFLAQHREKFYARS